MNLEKDNYVILQFCIFNHNNNIIIFYKFIINVTNEIILGYTVIDYCQ